MCRHSDSIGSAIRNMLIGQLVYTVYIQGDAQTHSYTCICNIIHRLNKLSVYELTQIHMHTYTYVDVLARLNPLYKDTPEMRISPSVTIRASHMHG